MNIEKIIKVTDWHKKWVVADFSLADSSCLGYYYTAACQARFGVSLNHHFFVYKDQAVICYQSVKENEVLGSTVAARFVNDRAEVNRLCAELTARTKEIRTLLQRPVVEFLEGKSFKFFEKLYYEYLPLYIGVIRSGNHLTGELANYAFPLLEGIRLRTETIYNETAAFLKKLSQEIQVTENYTKFNLADLLTREDLIAYFQTGKLPLPIILEERCFCNSIYTENGVSYFIPNKDSERFETAVAALFVTGDGMVKGETACPGKVVGTARLIQNPRAVKEFNEGDILITGMTRPDFVPLMKKSGAVVTDAGGVLCHAAIVSREMNKPCIIGTQVATRTFVDGDIIEVDATHGTVKKL